MTIELQIIMTNYLVVYVKYLLCQCKILFWTI